MTFLEQRYWLICISKKKIINVTEILWEFIKSNRTFPIISCFMKHDISEVLPLQLFSVDWPETETSLWTSLLICKTKGEWYWLEVRGKPTYLMPNFEKTGIP